MSASFTPTMAGLPLALIDSESEVLHDALTRYYVAMNLADVDSEGRNLVDPVVTANDRATYKTLLTDVVNDRNIVEFMHEVSGLSRPLCATWNYLDNVEVFEQGGQPDWATSDCYEFTLEIVKSDGSKAPA